MVQWIAQAQDHQGRPFFVIDKANARLYVFDRHVLMTASLPAATTQYIQQLVADLPHSARWQTLLRRYGLQQMNAPCPNF